ncbi:MAG: hypothetical protein JNJ48_03265, partial [Phycisphaerae bacterium]|nr:hypothetical protein [Phycisphaerae bacterium]
MNAGRGAKVMAAVLAMAAAAGLGGCNNAGEGAVAGGVIGALAGLGIG